MLELGGVAVVYRYHSAVDVQLAHDRAASQQFFPEGLRAALAQAEKTYEDVLFGILIAEEGLPTPIGHIISPNEFHLLGRG